MTKDWFLKEVSVPLVQDEELIKVQLAASSIVSSRPRTFEVFWDGSTFNLCFGASSRDDLDHLLENYRQHIKVGVVDELMYPTPEWLGKLDPSKTRFFYVGNAYGHAYCLYDVKRTGRLMTPLLLALQRSRFAWVQFLFFEYPLQRYLSELSRKMRDRFITIDTPIPKIRYWKDEDGKLRSEKYTVDHPAKFGEFHTAYRRLNSHITGKSGSRLIVMIIRGVVQPFDQMEGNEELPFSSIEDTDEIKHLAFEQVSTAVGENKIGERLQEQWTNDPRMIIDLVERRVFNIDKEMERYIKSYIRNRKNLPFVILTADEMGLLIHMPSSDLEGLRTTRQSAPLGSQVQTKKEGPELWS